MPGKERRGNTGEDQTGKHGYRQDVLLDLLAALGLGGPEDDALDLVVHAAACFERVRIGDGGEIVEVGLEEPECLWGLAGEQHSEVLQAHQERAVDRLFA